MTISELTQRALALSVEERRALVEVLSESLEEVPLLLPLQHWQKQLLDERLAEAARNPAVWCSGEEVEQEIASVLAAAARRRS